MSSLTLSKSTFVRGLQCEKSLYLHKKHPDFRNEISDAQEAIFAQGTDVGKLAQDLFPGGVDCSFEDFSQIDQCISDTVEYIKDGKRVIYEAAFRYDNVLVFADILVLHKDGWKMYEVKSSTKVKDTYLRDAALQTYVIRNCGVGLVDIYVIHINNQYVRNGELELDRLFNIVSVKKEVEELLPEIPGAIVQLQQVLQGDAIPEKSIGAHCSNPYPCDFSEYCWRDVLDKSVFDVRGLGANRKFELFRDGVSQMVDIPDNFKLNDKQRKQIAGEQTGQIFIERGPIKAFVDSLNYPLYFLDFETIGPAVPLFDFTSPYRQFPFQYSLHVLWEKGGALEHFEYLAETDGTDPRIKFIQQLIDDCGTVGDVVVYNRGFEQGKLRDLAGHFHQYKTSLLAIHDRMVDLMIPFQKGWYYTPDMNGSHSIKAVLPALVPELSYKELEIGDGGSASRIFEAMAAGTFDRDFDKTREQLLKYCELDTLAMVKILEKLQAI